MQVQAECGGGCVWEGVCIFVCRLNEGVCCVYSWCLLARVLFVCSRKFFTQFLNFVPQIIKSILRGSCNFPTHFQRPSLDFFTPATHTFIIYIYFKSLLHTTHLRVHIDHSHPLTFHSFFFSSPRSPSTSRSSTTPICTLLRKTLDWIRTTLHCSSTKCLRWVKKKVNFYCVVIWCWWALGSCLVAVLLFCLAV